MQVEGDAGYFVALRPHRYTNPSGHVLPPASRTGFGKEYSDAYVESEALLAHRRRLGEATYEEFTARADGYANAEAREREHDLRMAKELTHLLGQLSVGELMPYEESGWTLMRSGSRLWSEREGVTKVPYRLRPRIGSQRSRR